MSVIANHEPKEYFALASLPPKRMLPVFVYSNSATTISVTIATICYSQLKEFKDHVKIPFVTFVSHSLFMMPKIAAPPITRKQGINTFQRIGFLFVLFPSILFFVRFQNRLAPFFCFIPY